MLASPDPMRLYKELDEQELNAIAWVLNEAIRHLRMDVVNNLNKGMPVAMRPVHEMWQEFMDNYFTLRLHFARLEEAKASDATTEVAREGIPF